MSEASLESQRSLSDSQDEVQSDLDEAVSQSESCADDTHMTEISINDGSSDKNLHERNGKDEEGHQDAVMRKCSSNDRAHTVTEENSDPRSAHPETAHSYKVILSSAEVSAFPFLFFFPRFELL